jgi:uncharacterized protein YfiM (DUF2279 family)
MVAATHIALSLAALVAAQVPSLPPAPAAPPPGAVLRPPLVRLLAPSPRWHAPVLAGPGAPPPGGGAEVRNHKSAGPAPAQARPRWDPWFGDDKLRHLTMSFAATGFAFAAGRALGVGEAAAPAAAAASLASGIAKELYDVRAGRFFSIRDLAWDVAGVIAGYALARNVR